MKREERATNLAVGRGVDLATLSAVEKVIHHIVGALAVKRRRLTGSGISKMLGTLVVHCGLVEVQSIIGRRLGSIVAVWMRLVLVIRSHLAIVIIVAGSCKGGCQYLRFMYLKRRDVRLFIWGR